MVNAIDCTMSLGIETDLVKLGLENPYHIISIHLQDLKLCGKAVQTVTVLCPLFPELSPKFSQLQEI